jgi:hypothetical protein
VTDLATLDIRDRAARTGMLNARAQIATYRGDYAGAQAFVRDVRSQQEKAADKLTSGVTVENILAARIAGGPVEQQRAMVKENVTKAWNAMPWDVVGDNLKATKGSLEILSKKLVVGSFQSSLDPAAKNLNLNVPGNMVIAVVSARNTFEHVSPFKDDIVELAGLGAKAG